MLATKYQGARSICNHIDLSRRRRQHALRIAGSEQGIYGVDGGQHNDTLQLATDGGWQRRRDRRRQADTVRKELKHQFIADGNAIYRFNRFNRHGLAPRLLRWDGRCPDYPTNRV
jgi:hypothetical protein